VPAASEQQRQKKKVFLSYSWAHQSVVKKIVQALQEEEIEYWLDIEQIAGSTVEAMADGIDECAGNWCAHKEIDCAGTDLVSRLF
jgi:male-specific lethal 1